MQVERPLEELEAALQAAFSDICTSYGQGSAIQAIGRLLLTVPSNGGEGGSYQRQGTSTSVDESVSDVASPPGTAPAAGDATRKGSASAAAGGLAAKLGKWRHAVSLAKKTEDPWASRALHLLRMECAVRHRYNPRTGQWVTDDVLVKIEGRPFAAGAMRECFAMKKLSTFGGSVYHDWRSAQNCVAKRYKKEHVKRDMYYTDVLVQMDAKLLGEEYNKTDPPKQVDVMQCAVVEFRDRQGSPLFCIERLIEGDYVKYNSNSGFVQGDDLLRHTPQAFSHFTFEWSRGRKICVDVQGVGDLFTDPQIHTLDGEGYGEGNLGLRGMALFFRSHECNPLCQRIKLQPFKRCEEDVKAQGYNSESSTGSMHTVSRTFLRRGASTRVKLAQARGPSLRRGVARSKEDLLLSLQAVPLQETPEALVHLEVAKLYSEVVLLPELRPMEDPADCLRGALYHLQHAAQLGCLLACALLARAHCGLQPSSTQFAHLVKEGVKSGDLTLFPELAFRYCRLAAERGVVSAAAALAHAYTTGGGIGEGLLPGPMLPEAVQWWRQVLAGVEAAAAEEAAAGAATVSGTLGDVEEAPEEDGAHDNGANGANGSEPPLSPGAAPLSPGSGGPARQQQYATSTRSRMSNDFLNMSRQGSAKDDGTGAALPLGTGPNGRSLFQAAAEEEASGLPFATQQKFEVLAMLGKLLLEGGEGLEADNAAAADYLSRAAEEAAALGKGRLAQKYYELAAQAEGM